MGRECAIPFIDREAVWGLWWGREDRPLAFQNPSGVRPPVTFAEIGHDAGVVRRHRDSRSLVRRVGSDIRRRFPEGSLGTSFDAHALQRGELGEVGRPPPTASISYETNADHGRAPLITSPPVPTRRARAWTIAPNSQD